MCRHQKLLRFGAKLRRAADGRLLFSSSPAGAQPQISGLFYASLRSRIFSPLPIWCHQIVKSKQVEVFLSLGWFGDKMSCASEPEEASEGKEEEGGEGENKEAAWFKLLWKYFS